MGFHNEVLSPDAVPRRRERLGGRLWGIRVCLRGWIRRALAALGLPSAPGLEERLRTGALEGIARERRFPPGWQPEEVLAWLDETVLRAPCPGGKDEQLILLAVIEGDRVRRRQFRLVDKYGWRRAGREETRRWLEEAGAGALEAVVMSLFSPALLKNGPD